MLWLLLHHLRKSDYNKAVEEVKNDSTKLLVVIPKNFSEVFEYDLIYKKNQRQSQV